MGYKLNRNIERESITQQKRESPHTMLLASQPAQINGQPHQAKLSSTMTRPKPINKITMMGAPYRSSNQPTQLQGNQLTPVPLSNTSPRKQFTSARKVSNQLPPVPKNIVHNDTKQKKEIEEWKNKAILESQQKEGCFAPVLNSAHFNPLIPCLPIHLMSNDSSMSES